MPALESPSRPDVLADAGVGITGLSRRAAAIRAVSRAVHTRVTARIGPRACVCVRKRVLRVCV